ncbi:MAG: hypothetical protein IKN81_09545 [Oscillospiraceae bacterium]|nr:hypothetical protein [Oscillospiraceae bacterium]
MTEFTCSFAGTNVTVRALFPQTEAFCRDYLTDGAAAFTVEITPEDITYEQAVSDKTAAAEGRRAHSFSDSYLETLAVYRKVADGLSAYHTILFHGSVVAVDGEAYLFTAPSGTGKSTHARLWRELFGERAYMVNDDKPLLKISDSGVLAYGTPWDGKHRLSRNVCVPLKAICLLERGENNRIEPCTSNEIYPNILGQTYRPKNAEQMLRVLNLVDQLVQGVSLYKLRCNMHPDAARVSYEAMSGRELEEP